MSKYVEFKTTIDPKHGSFCYVETEINGKRFISDRSIQIIAVKHLLIPISINSESEVIAGDINSSCTIILKKEPEPVKEDSSETVKDESSVILKTEPKPVEDVPMPYVRNFDSKAEIAINIDGKIYASVSKATNDICEFLCEHFQSYRIDGNTIILNCLFQDIVCSERLVPNKKDKAIGIICGLSSAKPELIVDFLRGMLEKSDLTYSDLNITESLFFKETLNNLRKTILKAMLKTGKPETLILDGRFSEMPQIYKEALDELKEVGRDFSIITESLMSSLEATKEKKDISQFINIIPKLFTVSDKAGHELLAKFLIRLGAYSSSA